MSEVYVNKNLFETSTQVDLFRLQRLVQNNITDEKEIIGIPLGVLKRLVLDRLNAEKRIKDWERELVMATRYNLKTPIQVLEDEED